MNETMWYIGIFRLPSLREGVRTVIHLVIIDG